MINHQTGERPLMQRLRNFDGHDVKQTYTDAGDRIELLERELAEERALLDLLDREANDEPIVLHNLANPRFRDGFRGLGLKNTGRSLRDALKQWVAAGIGAATSVPPRRRGR